MRYLHAYSHPFWVTDRERVQHLAQELGLLVEENPVDGSFSIEVRWDDKELIDLTKVLTPFLRELIKLSVIEFRLSVCLFDTERERPFDVVFYRIWAGKAWTVWLDALELGLCRQAIDPDLWTDLADLGLV